MPVAVPNIGVEQLFGGKLGKNVHFIVFYLNS